jgi:hypothetical protein
VVIWIVISYSSGSQLLWDHGPVNSLSIRRGPDTGPRTGDWETLPYNVVAVTDIWMDLLTSAIRFQCLKWGLGWFAICLCKPTYYWWGGTKSLGTAQVPRFCKSLVTAATFGLLHKPQMIEEDDFWSNLWNEYWQGKPKYSEKTCPSATLSTTKSHMTRPGLEPRTAAVGSQRLTARAMARPDFLNLLYFYSK